VSSIYRGVGVKAGALFVLNRSGHGRHNDSNLNSARRDIELMTIHKKILEWQAAHPNITWIVWGVVWVIVFIIMFWPRKSG
jgi:hypothetical protein